MRSTEFKPNTKNILSINIYRLCSLIVLITKVIQLLNSELPEKLSFQYEFIICKISPWLSCNCFDKSLVMKS